MFLFLPTQINKLIDLYLKSRNLITWGDTRIKNWKYRFTQRVLCLRLVLVGCHLFFWDIWLISLSDLCLAYFLRKISPRGLVENNRIALAPRKGLASSTCTRIRVRAPGKYWYVLSSSICRGCPGQFFKKYSVVSSFLDEFARVEKRSL